MTETVRITPATPADLREVRAMLHEYAAWVGIDLGFQAFAQEVAALPGDYAPPAGALLIARHRADIVGMVACRRRADRTAEMKRLFVRPAARGLGAGEQLVGGIIAAARKAGYQRMVLDTLPAMTSAQRLYERLGFRDTDAYYDSPVAGTRYMSLTLSV